MPKTTYDDIVRKTVPEPDSSFRPSPEQIQQAKDGFRALDADEQALEARVRSALAGASGVTVEVARDRVTLRGSVDQATANQLADRVRAIEGVSSVDDQLVIN
jgi:osmotically-inducible protein OsmY